MNRHFGHFARPYTETLHERVGGLSSWACAYNEVDIHVTNQAQFSSGSEQWSEISNFPGYSVSSWGRVRRDITNTYVTPTSKSEDGLVMVGLMKWSEEQHRSIQRKRSLPLLVASAFVGNPRPGVFDTPINRDGDRTNNFADNLLWRPLWFARQYIRQFVVPHATYDDEIVDVETHITYKNTYSAAIHHGLLEQEIVMSMHNNTYVFPTGQIFRKVHSR